MIKKLLNILYLMVLNLLYFSGGLLIWVILGSLVDSLPAHILFMVIIIILIVFLIASSNYLVYKSYFHSTINIKLYIGLCIVEYVGIILSTLRLVSLIAD